LRRVTISTLRICLVADSLERRGGADRSLVLLANALAERGHRVTALLRARGGSVEGTHPRVAIEVLPTATGDTRRWIRVPALVFSLTRRLRDIDPDVVVAFKPENAIPALLAATIARVPMVVSERVSLADHKHYWHWRLGRRLMYGRAAALVAQTERLVADARRLAPKASIHVVPNMVVIPAGTNGGSVWDRFPSGRPQGRLITIGRLAQQKGLDRLIDAFADLALAVPEWCLAIIGAGPLQDDLDHRISAAGLDDRVKLMGAVDDPFPSLRDSHVFALASRYEGFPNALLEAMSVGLAVVAYDCPTGPRELIDDEANGLLIPDGDTRAFADGLLRAMTDESLRSRLGARAKRAAEEFAPERIVGRWEAVLREAASPRR